MLFRSIQKISENDFEIFPNPSKGDIQINSGKHLISEILIYSLQGALILKKTTELSNSNTYSLKTDGLDKGYYIMQIFTRNQEVISKNLVLQ